ncbi:MAG: alpha/beta hydrolase [Myxococcota bacterium]|nr:alpha/beta hydrolase [Myxococcota bacterium]
MNGFELAYFEWGRELRGARPTVLFVHATGFHARVFDRVIDHLGERHVVSVDQRGHGRSGGKVPVRHWRDMGEDLAALVRELGLEGAIGVGHSMGGHALVDAAAACTGAFARLVLIDPVIASPGEYPGGGWKAEHLPGGVHPTARRKNRFASREAMVERFADRSPYSLFEPEALRDYCEWGLLPASDGDGYVLACPPEVEASVYMTSRTNPGIHDSVRALDVPVLVLRAREHSGDGGAMDFTSSPTWPGLAGEFRRGRDVHLRDRTHFLPMEAPALVAAYVLEEPSGPGSA